jgi:predicted oxidoreductase
VSISVALWQIHRPDMLTHPAKTARTLEAAHKAGKIGAVGVSNYTPAQVEALAVHLSLPIVSCQPEFSALASARCSTACWTRPWAATWPFWPGRRWAAAASPIRGTSAAARSPAILDEVAEYAGVSRAAAAYSWIMAHPARPIPIVGSQTVARIAEIPDAYKPRWTRADWYRVLVASMGANLP